MGLVLNDRISPYGLFWVIDLLLYGCGGDDERVSQQRYSFLVLLLSERKTCMSHVLCRFLVSASFDE